MTTIKTLFICLIQIILLFGVAQAANVNTSLWHDWESIDFSQFKGDANFAMTNEEVGAFKIHVQLHFNHGQAALKKGDSPEYIEITQPDFDADIPDVTENGQHKPPAFNVTHPDFNFELPEYTKGKYLEFDYEQGSLPVFEHLTHPEKSGYPKNDQTDLNTIEIEAQ
ncbi:MAG: hypothetical protein HRU38_02625 [Saccharospirillaceae bacterium]|nr:hypothetical protein [Pseudomonadales bacterium]NRB77556.1 hypothetical protein [Saccharospirillaceae bacterium]